MVLQKHLLLQKNKTYYQCWKQWCLLFIHLLFYLWYPTPLPPQDSLINRIKYESNFAYAILCQSYQYNEFPTFSDASFVLAQSLMHFLTCNLSPASHLQKTSTKQKVPQSRWISCRGQTMPVQARWGERCGKLVYPVAGCFVTWCW